MGVRVGAWLAAGFAAWLLGGCAGPAPVSLSPEAALPQCQSEALREIRRFDDTAASVTLEPLAGGGRGVEQRSPPPGHEGVGLVIRGRGTATGGGTGGFRYTCLVGTSGNVLFVDVMPDGTSQVMTECAAGKSGGLHACLRDLAASSDRALARAEAQAVEDARRRASGKRSEVDEPAAESIGAWRVYRDAECQRRFGASAGSEDRVAACTIELNRARIAELGGG